jgi:hypothetical protein
MLGPHGVISIRVEVKCDYDCDRESCETVNRLMAFTELQDLKHALAESPPGIGHAQGQDLQDIHPAGGLTKQDDPVVHGGAFQGYSHRQ